MGVDKSQLLLLVGIVIAFLVNIAFAIGERLLKRWNLIAALEMGPGATPHDLRKVVEQVAPITRIQQVVKLSTPELHDSAREAVQSAGAGD